MGLLRVLSLCQPHGSATRGTGTPAKGLLHLKWAQPLPVPAGSFLFKTNKQNNNNAVLFALV